MMNRVLHKGTMFEIIDLTDRCEDYRLYCENISSARESHILSNLDVEYTVQSRCNEQYDGALILDFKPVDLDTVRLYFGDRDE
tara:strand:+ start:1580 stop:1828 length:249 start_codon:yes stop_codon:yes gene_type:complete